jgi:hypothetical protein
LSLGGHLFPSGTELLNPPHDGVYKTRMPYEFFSSKFKSLCEELFNRKRPWGTHSCRKTGYLFAIWSGATFDMVMQSARHSDVMTAKKYERDARALMALAEV